MALAIVLIIDLGMAKVFWADEWTILPGRANHRFILSTLCVQKGILYILSDSGIMEQANKANGNLDFS